jgi:transposase-like protein
VASRQPKSPDWTPRPKQALVLEAARKAGLRRNLSVICREAGVDRSALYKWRRDDPDFKAAWDGMWEEMLALHFNGVVAAQIKKAEDGSAPAARLLAEMRGVLTKRVEVSGKDGEPIGIALKVEDLTDEQLKALVSLDPTLIKGGKQ